MLSKKHHLKFLIATCLFYTQIACDEQKDNRQLISWSSADQEAESGAVVEVYLPDRSQLSSQSGQVSDLINAFYLHIVPEGLNCLDTNSIELFDKYSDSRLISFNSYRRCDYRIKLLIGYAEPGVLASVKKGPALSLQSSPVNYQDHIQPLIQQHCLSCHPSFETYQGVYDEAVEVAFRVENRLMPPNNPLDNEKIALFLAWQANDFAERDQRKPEEGSLMAGLSQVFYRNNIDTMIFEYLLIHRSRFVYQDSLWLQSDGEANGLETLEWLIVEPLDD